MFKVSLRIVERHSMEIGGGLGAYLKDDDIMSLRVVALLYFEDVDFRDFAISLLCPRL